MSGVSYTLTGPGRRSSVKCGRIGYRPSFVVLLATVNIAPGALQGLRRLNRHSRRTEVVDYAVAWGWGKRGLHLFKSCGARSTECTGNPGLPSQSIGNIGGNQGNYMAEPLRPIMIVLRVPEHALIALNRSASMHPLVRSLRDVSYPYQRGCGGLS